VKQQTLSVQIPYLLLRCYTSGKRGAFVPGAVYQFEEFQLDCGRFELTRNGRSLPVERKPMELLILLAERRGQLLTRAEIAERLWEREVFVDTEHGINTAIRKIRQTLRDNADEPRFVETVIGKGYRFVAPVAVGKNDETEPSPGDSDAGAASNGPSTVTEAVELDPNGRSRTFLDDPENEARWHWLVWAIPVLLVAATVVLAVRFWPHRRATEETSIHSLAVIPLDNVSGTPGQDYLVDGLTDELTTMLAKNSTLNVTSRTSVMQYKGIHRPLRQIAQELGVDAIIEGSVARSGDKVHMTIQLIQAQNDRHLWAESYDREMKDLVGLPREAAETIARRLKSSVPPHAAARYVSPEAHDAYVHGHYLWTTFNFDEAHKYLQRAVDLQPDYALGWSGLADYYGAGAASGHLDPREALPQEEIAATKALQLDDSLAQAHVAMAAMYFFVRWDWAGADRETLRAIELDPKLADAYYFRAIVLMALNRKQEAIESQKRSVEIEPFGRPSALPDFYIEAREYDAALKEAFQRLESMRNNSGLYSSISHAYWYKGMYKEAVEFDAKAHEVDGDKEYVEGVRRAYQQGGARLVSEWGLSLVKKSAAEHYVSPMELASQYGELGEREKTLAFLDEAYRQHAPPLLFWLQTNPNYAFLHDDPRYRALIQKIGLPPAY